MKRNIILLPEVVTAAKELNPFIITLSGEEAMELVMMILEAEIKDANIDPMLWQITHLVRNEKKVCAEAVAIAIQQLARAGFKLPRYLPPLMTHVVSKILEVTEQ